MAAERALPDLKSKIDVNTSGLKKAEAEARAASGGMHAGMGKASVATKNLTKDLEGMGHESAKSIPILGSFGGAMGGLPIPLLVTAAAAGILIETGMKVIEVSDKWEASQVGLKQATTASGVSLNESRQFVDKFIGTNKRYVQSQSEVVDSYAAFIRQGVAAKTAQQDLNLALDLAALKHISLTAASSALQKMEAGKGKALLELGIVMKDYPVLMEDAHAASLKLEAAEKAVAKATALHTAAVKAHGSHSAQAKAAAAALATANVALAEAHSYAARRAEASKEVHDLLEKKLHGGRESTAELTQVQNQLGNVWQSFAIKTGPALTHMLVVAEEVLIKVVTVILDAITVMGTWKGLWDVLGRIMSIVIAIVKVEFTVALAVARAEIGLIVGVVTTLVGWFQRLAEGVRTVIDFLGKIKVPDIKLPFGIGGPAGTTPTQARPHRAAGGPVLPNSVYTVGEHGPEPLVMGSQGGYVVPNGASWSPGGGRSGGGGSSTFHLHVSGFVGDEKKLFRVFREGIRQLDRAQSQ